MTTFATTTLECRTGGHDKLYVLSVVARGDEYVVTACYGRRDVMLNGGGRTVTRGTYSSLNSALSAYEAQTRSKLFPSGRKAPYIQVNEEINCAAINAHTPGAGTPASQASGQIASAQYDWSRCGPRLSF